MNNPQSQPALTCSKLTIETLEQGCSSVSIINFEHLIAGWDTLLSLKQILPYKFNKLVIQLTWKNVSFRHVFGDKNRNATFT